MHESGDPELTAGAVERVRQIAVANFQLLVMLEVVREWGRSDAVDLAEAAEHTEAMSAALVPLAGLGAPAEDLARAHRQLDEVQQKLDRLSQLVPLQSREPAVVGALTEGLRRLRVANEAAQSALQSTPPHPDV